MTHIKTGQPLAPYYEQVGPNVQVFGPNDIKPDGDIALSSYKGKYMCYYESLGGTSLRRSFGDHIEFDRVFARIKQYTSGFAGKFVEETKNPAFRRYINRFFSFMYMKEKVYVWKNIEEDCYYPFYKMNEESDICRKYRNIITEEIYEFDPLELVCCYWNGDYFDRFTEWYYDVYEILIDENRIKWMRQLCLKRVNIYAQGRNDFTIKTLIQSFATPTPFSVETSGLQATADVDPVYYFSPLEVDEYQVGHYRFVDRVLNKHHMTTNINRKNERLTKDENLTYLQAVADEDRKTLNQLEMFAHDIKEKWGDELVFCINRPENATPGDENGSETADTSHEADATSDEK